MENVRDAREERIPRDWLKLSLGEDLGSPVEDCGLSICTSPNLDVSCKFCMKTFDSIQALGGHQNAHNTERSIARRKRKTKMIQNQVPSLSLVIQAHSFVQKPNREGIVAIATASRLSELSNRDKWADILPLNKKSAEEASHTEKLDLNLKLL